MVTRLDSKKEKCRTALSLLFSDNLASENQELGLYHLSAYSKWLNENESDLIISYSQLGTKAKNTDLKNYYSYESNFFVFFHLVFNEYKVYEYDYEKNTITLIKTTDQLYNLVLNSLRERDFKNFFIDELDLLIIGNYDLTFPLVSMNQQIDNRMVKLINFSGLNLLMQKC